VVEEAMVRSREELRRQFAADDPSNPLAGFQRQSIGVMRQAFEQQSAVLRAMEERVAALQAELARTRAEKEGAAELEAERERGTAKGRSFEEEVFEAIDALSHPLGDVAEAVGDLREATGKKGDVVVQIGACDGPARGRIVFEAKNARMTRPKALEELDQAKAERGADFAVLVVSSEEKVPARMQDLREYNGDKLIAVYEPADGPLALQLAYKLARARVLMVRGGEDAIDAGAVRDTVERAVGAMEDVRRVKQQLTGARTSIDKAEKIVGEMADRVRAHLAEIDALLAPAAEEQEASP
jgi:HAMP domain-containing protein